VAGSRACPASAVAPSLLGRLTVALSACAAWSAPPSALAVLAPPPAAHASPELQTGISDDGVLLFDPAGAPQAVARWAVAGIDTVRVQVRRVGVARDPDDPGYDWAYLDRAIGRVAAPIATEPPTRPCRWRCPPSPAT